jgi:hypothetical protein
MEVHIAVSTQSDERLRLADQLYEQYGKPLEPEHTGEYVAISPSGQTVLGSTVAEAMERADTAQLSDSIIFHIGQRWVWKLR